MIKALSPYYITIPWVAPLSGETATQFTLNIYVWSGLKSDVPTTPTYTIIKDNATSSTDNIKINIANWIADFIDFTPQEGSTTELIDGNNQQWIKWETYYQTSNVNDALIQSNENVKLFLRGYSYGLDGENATLPANKILIPIQDYKVSDNSKFVVPILINETTIDDLIITITNVVENSLNDYDIFYDTSREISNLIVYVRDYGDVDWNYYIVVPPIDSPVNLLSFISEFNDYEFMISTFDNLTGTTIYSNIFRLEL